MSDSSAPSPEQLNSLFEIACGHHQQGHLHEAKSAYLELLSHVSAPLLYYNLGLVHHQLKEMTEARDCFASAHAAAPDDMDCLFNLALCQKECGEYEKAVTSYMKVLETDENCIDAMYNLAGCHRSLRNDEQAITLYEKVLQMEPDHEAATNNLAYMYHLSGQTDEAIACYGRLLEINPERQEARHMLAALRGETPAEGPPSSYIQGLFDNFSAHYDHSLQNQLDYNVPARLCELIFNHDTGWQHFHHGIDLGCGTGLSGVAFQGKVERLDGIDLSTKMLEHAKTKSIYHELHTGDIVSFISQTSARYDLFIAADVLVYLGDLLPLFAAMRHCRQEGCCFCFSTETASGSDYTLKPSGRFGHSRDYIARLAEETGWLVEKQQECDLRKEGRDWIGGTLWVLRG